VKPPKKVARRPSPTPAIASIAARRVIDGAAGPRRGSLPGVVSDQRKAAILAAGPLAYLDDSSDEDVAVRPTRRTARNQSPSPRTTSALRSDTPSGSRLAVSQPAPAEKPAVPIPLHTVASPFAGTVSRITSHVMWRTLH
jgi:hypothetical protein